MAEKKFRQQVEDIRAVPQLQPAAPNLQLMNTSVPTFRQEIHRGDIDNNPLTMLAASLQQLNKPLGGLLDKSIAAEEQGVIQKAKELAYSDISPDDPTVQELMGHRMFSKEFNDTYTSSRLKRAASEIPDMVEKALMTDSGRAVLESDNPEDMNNFLGGIVKETQSKFGIDPNNTDKVKYFDDFESPVRSYIQKQKLKQFAVINERRQDRVAQDNQDLLEKNSQTSKVGGFFTTEEKERAMSHDQSSLQSYLTLANGEDPKRRTQNVVELQTKLALKTGDSSHLDVLDGLSDSSGIRIKEIKEYKNIIDHTRNTLIQTNEKTERAMEEVEKHIQQDLKAEASNKVSDLLMRTDEAMRGGDKTQSTQALRALQLEAQLLGGDALSKVQSRITNNAKMDLDPEIEADFYQEIEDAPNRSLYNKISTAEDHGQITHKTALTMRKRLATNLKHEQKEEKEKTPVNRGAYTDARKELKKQLEDSGIEADSPEMSRYLAQYADRAKELLNKNPNASEERRLELYQDVASSIGSRAHKEKALQEQKAKNDASRREVEKAAQEFARKNPAKAQQLREQFNATKQPDLGYGKRTDGSFKGAGYFGELKRTDNPKDISTELEETVEVNGREFGIPLIVPTLTKDELDHLLAGKEPTEQIRNKAFLHAQQRMKAGKSPFAQSGEQQHPIPRTTK